MKSMISKAVVLVMAAVAVSFSALSSCTRQNTAAHKDTDQNTTSDSGSLSFSDITVSVKQPEILAESLSLQIRPNGKRLIGITSRPVENSEKYQDLSDNELIIAADQPVSTFSIDVDTGSYSNVRRFISSGKLPPRDAIRIEELVNYFTYQYDLEQNPETPFSINTEVATTPWNDKTRLLHIGLQGYKPVHSRRPDANLVFLVDVSGSMNAANKLGLLKSSIKIMSNRLTQHDHVAIVTYAGSSGIALEPTPGHQRAVISHALDSLSAGGSTNGEHGIRVAYQLAMKNFKTHGINRVILATDGDFNVGISDVETLKKLIITQRKSGVALSTLGFGTGDYNDHLMEQLADAGNGAYAYIDNLSEARKALVQELDATLMTIARDVKVQIEFNPRVVSEYRLIGYVNRLLPKQDFNNDKVDAGEIGAGHTVTALYEIALVGEGGERSSRLRYGAFSTSTQAVGQRHQSSDPRAFSKDTHGMLGVVGRHQHDNELAQLRLRYKSPRSLDRAMQGSGTPSIGKSRLVSALIMRDDVVGDEQQTSNNFRFAAAVAAFGQRLRDNKYFDDFDFDDIALLAQASRGKDLFGYRAGFVQLVQLAGELESQEYGSFGFNPRSGNELLRPGQKVFDTEG